MFGAINSIKDDKLVRKQVTKMKESALKFQTLIHKIEST